MEAVDAPDVRCLAQTAVSRATSAGLTIATVESCTGGLVAGALTDIAGSSAAFDRGFVTYSNEAKTDLVGVPAALLESHGAVSAPVAQAMAEGGLGRASSDIAVAVTGIAGPGGGSADKPVGLVHFAVAMRDSRTRLDVRVFPGDRLAVRAQTVVHALRMLIEALDQAPRRVIGIDFSAAQEMRRHLWIAELSLDRAERRLSRLFPLSALPHHGRGAGLRGDAVWTALRTYLKGRRAAVIGIDAPFALPAVPTEGGGEEDAWRRWALSLAVRTPDAAQMRAESQVHWPGRERKRRCDHESAAPFSPYNLRVFRQTYAVVRHILAPFIADGSMAVVPMMFAIEGRPVIAECCPASRLKRLGLRGGYKGRSPAAADQRSRIADHLEAEDHLSITPEHRRILVTQAGGDALDAVLAAISAAELADAPEQWTARNDLDRIEGRIYF